MAHKLIVHMEIHVGEGNEEDYAGVLEAILEESGHYGDFDVDVKREAIVNEDNQYELVEFAEAAIL
jgi:hypothetical protein